MEWVETTGRTISQAQEAALDQLGVDEQEAEIQILEEPQTGLFGRLRVEARVRARVRPKAPPAKTERRDRRRGGRRRRKDQDGAAREQKATGSGATKATGSASADAVTAPAEQAVTTTQPGQGGGQSKPSSRKRRRRRSRGTGSGAQQGAKVSNNERSETSAAGEPADVEAQRQAVDTFLTELLVAFGRPEASVSTSVAEDATIEVDVRGEELGLLIGPKGQTLQALHELTRSMVQRQFVGESHARLQLDVAGYRKRRTEALERFTREVAEEVVSSGRAKALDPMTAGDRKVVHDTVNEIDGVRTISEGDEPERRVVIEKTP